MLGHIGQVKEVAQVYTYDLYDLFGCQSLSIFRQSKEHIVRHRICKFYIYFGKLHCFLLNKLPVTSKILRLLVSSIDKFHYIFHTFSQDFDCQKQFILTPKKKINFFVSFVLTGYKNAKAEFYTFSECSISAKAFV